MGVGHDFIVTNVMPNVENLKGVPKKIFSMFFEVKSQKFKLKPIVPKFTYVVQNVFNDM